MKRLHVLVLCPLVVPVGATAQVGHAPTGSPFTDLRTNHTISMQAGYLLGSGGLLGLGPADGPIGGVRYEVRVGAPTELSLGFSFADLERSIVDPNLPPEVRTSGPFRTHMTFVEGAINLNLTGKKAWHRLAPYAGVFVGLAFGGTLRTDPSNFTFDTKFFVGPQLGTRWHLTSKLLIRFEVRDMLWRLSYPSSFEIEDPNLGFEPPLAADDPRDQWTHQPVFSIGLGYTFRY